MKTHSLNNRVNRAKARWLKRVMYASAATSTQKCFAYAVADHLNCVTLDCWPAQGTLARLLRAKSVKTVQRAARGLEALGLVAIRPRSNGKAGYRYAPVFLPGDEDNSGPAAGHPCPDDPDSNGGESFLEIHKKSFSTAAQAKNARQGVQSNAPFAPSQRGAIEIQVAERLGGNGMDILSRLASIDDAIVDRLCRAHAGGVLGERDLAAARLAAEQA
jgi:hypothetical protein